MGISFKNIYVCVPKLPMGPTFFGVPTGPSRLTRRRDVPPSGMLSGLTFTGSLLTLITNVSSQNKMIDFYCDGKSRKITRK